MNSSLSAGLAHKDVDLAGQHNSQMTQIESVSQCFANAEIVLLDRTMRGAVHIEGDKIVGIEEGDVVPHGAVDLEGDFLLPGLIELHTDNLERHIEPRPKVKLPLRNALLAHDAELASVGITTVFDALRLGFFEQQHSPDTGRYARKTVDEILALRAQDALKIRHLIHLRAEVCSETLPEELEDFGPQDRVGLVSLMDHTPGQRQFRDVSKLWEYMSRKHNFTPEEFEAHVAMLKGQSESLGAKHEKAVVDAAARYGAVLASHDDTTQRQVVHSANLGIRLGEFPTTLEAAEACREAGIAIIMGAPNLIRGGSHSGNVSAKELAEAGLLDIVSSDYVPSLLLASAFKLADIWGDLSRAVRTVSANPSKATDLSDRGQIATGKYADLVRVRMVDSSPVIRNVWRGGKIVG